MSAPDVIGNPAPSELMGHSPPASPRATQSPFMFTPQVPVVPLQRPDEMHVLSPSWMQTTSGYEDVYCELGIPTMITWSYDGEEVAVEGSWDNWKTRMPLQRSGKDFTIMKDYVPEDIGSISSFEPPKSPDSSYNNLQLSSEDYAKEPPLVPPFLQMTLLNVPSTNMEIQPLMSRPQHVLLNHLYMQKEKSSPSVVALGTTHRFLAKYVTVVLYKSLQR
ncbi:Immunoglobulin-like fold [Sesbania bispinosa]|nr:Immunoglobulin-like fold [Sesbania bispinosa]